MNWKRREGDSTLPTRMTCDSMTQQMHPSICSLFAFATICTGEGGVPLLARARINFRRKEGVIQRWLSTGDAIYSGIETIKLIFPHSPPSSFQRYMQIITSCECVFTRKCCCSGTRLRHSVKERIFILDISRIPFRESEWFTSVHCRKNYRQFSPLIIPFHFLLPPL